MREDGRKLRGLQERGRPQVGFVPVISSSTNENKAWLQIRLNAIPIILIGWTERTRLKNLFFRFFSYLSGFFVVEVVNLIAPIT